MTTRLAFDVLTVDELTPALEEAPAAGPLVAGKLPDELPDAPGVYVWVVPTTDAVAYIGSAAPLAKRVGDELNWIRDYDPADQWGVSVIHLLKHLRAKPRWAVTDSHEKAVDVERKLIEWHRARVGCAPLLVGWDANPRPGHPSPTQGLRTPQHHHPPNHHVARTPTTPNGPSPAKPGVGPSHTTQLRLRRLQRHYLAHQALRHGQHAQFRSTRRAWNAHQTPNARSTSLQIDAPEQYRQPISRDSPETPGTPGRTRTDTGTLLRGLPLPLGYGGAGPSVWPQPQA